MKSTSKRWQCYYYTAQCLSLMSYNSYIRGSQVILYSGELESQSYVRRSFSGNYGLLPPSASLTTFDIATSILLLLLLLLLLLILLLLLLLLNPATTTASLCHFHRLHLLQDHGTTGFSKCTVPEAQGDTPLYITTTESSWAGILPQGTSASTRASHEHPLNPLNSLKEAAEKGTPCCSGDLTGVQLTGPQFLHCT